MSIQINLQKLYQDIKPAKLLVVSKNRSANEIRDVIKSGVKYIGENKLQEILEKYDRGLFRELQTAGVELHFIGHIQSNKVNKIVRLCDVIQSVDTLEIAEKINRASEATNKVMPIFLQPNLTGEGQKYGLSVEQLEETVDIVNSLKNMELRGLMCMGMIDDEEVSREAFKKCRELADKFQLKEVSMGMSGDYQIALEEGSTMVRLGTLVFE